MLLTRRYFKLMLPLAVEDNIDYESQAKGYNNATLISSEVEARKLGEAEQVMFSYSWSHMLGLAPFYVDSQVYYTNTKKRTMACILLRLFYLRPFFQFMVNLVKVIVLMPLAFVDDFCFRIRELCWKSYSYAIPLFIVGALVAAFLGLLGCMARAVLWFTVPIFSPRMTLLQLSKVSHGRWILIPLCTVYLVAVYTLLAVFLGPMVFSLLTGLGCNGILAVAIMLLPVVSVIIEMLHEPCREGGQRRLLSNCRKVMALVCNNL